MELREALKILEAPEFKGDLGNFVELVKSNFKKLILKFHPDKGGDQEKAKLILLAFTEFKTALSIGALNDMLPENFKAKSKEEFRDWVKSKTKYADVDWDEDWRFVESITEILTGNMGSLSKLLTSLPTGLHWMVHRGMRFQVSVKDDKDGHIYQILTRTIKIVKGLLPEGVNPVMYLLGK